MDRVTGAVEKRKRAPAYEELLADARRRRFGVVLVWKFDRFARSLSALLEALRLFEVLGIDFISATQAIDTTTPMGRLFFSLVGAFAEFERELIQERARVGLENARRRGVRVGRPRSPDVEQRILDLNGQGLSGRAIAAAVGWSPAGVRQALKRSTLASPAL